MNKVYIYIKKSNFTYYMKQQTVFIPDVGAIWIVLGRKDVEFLTIFNKRMADYSDDGKTFHAPYGWRLRRWGVKSEDILVSENLQANKGYDQILDAIRI